MLKKLDSYCKKSNELLVVEFAQHYFFDLVKNINLAISKDSIFVGWHL